MQGWRKTENERRRERYRSDPEYRAKRLAQSRENYARNPARHAERYRGVVRDPEERRAAKAARRARLRDAFVETVTALVVLERDDGVCGICGGDVDPAKFEVDHVLALSDGGWHAYDNVQVAHPVCNRRKWRR